MNCVQLTGRLAKDVSCVLTEKGMTISKFVLAVDREVKKEGQPKADFIPVVTFGKLAVAVGNYLEKGQRASVRGRLQIRSYEKDGERRYMTEVIAQSVEFLSDRVKQEEKQEKPAAPKKTRKRTTEKSA
jgi:single-strand DNA-binding protein